MVNQQHGGLGNNPFITAGIAAIGAFELAKHFGRAWPFLQGSSGADDWQIY
jgi:hypothetical protein